jgi:Concanavalin A-like lectin/glucanases superfamily
MHASALLVRACALGALAAGSLGCALLAGDDFGGYQLTSGSAAGGAGGSGSGAAGGGGAPACDAAYTSAVLADHPAGYWKLDEGAGITAVSEVGPVGTYTGDVVFGAHGATASCGWAVEFPMGTSLHTTAFEYPGMHSFSLEVWIHDSSIGYAIAETDGTTGTNGYGLRVGAGNVLEFHRWDQGNDDLATATIVGTWSHVVATYDGTAMRLFVNGMSSTDFTAQYATGAVANPTFFVSAAGFTGVLDEVAVYDHALSGNAVKAHHDAAVAH